MLPIITPTVWLSSSLFISRSQLRRSSPDSLPSVCHKSCRLYYYCHRSVSREISHPTRFDSRKCRRRFCLIAHANAFCIASIVIQLFYELLACLLIRGVTKWSAVHWCRIDWFAWPKCIPCKYLNIFDFDITDLYDTIRRYTANYFGTKYMQPVVFLLVKKKLFE